MKASGIFKGILLGLSLLLAASAFASNKGSLQLNSPASIGGKQLAAGKYTVQWDGTGPEVQLNILQGSKVVATAPAHINNVDRALDQNQAVITTNSDGSRSVTEIRFSGKKYTLAIADGSGGSSAGSGSSSR